MLLSVAYGFSSPVAPPMTGCISLLAFDDLYFLGVLPKCLTSCEVICVMQESAVRRCKLEARHTSREEDLCQWLISQQGQRSPFHFSS